MDRIGSERQGLVREIFRNLVTAQGTRAVIDREELLSAFPEREVARRSSHQLIDARLVTSYEVEGKEDEPSHHRIEVVHESLLEGLAAPRALAGAGRGGRAVLRDQLKQAAHLWEEKGRTPDLLWSGTAFREYELWRERYPGKLTALEEDFSRSMVERARRTTAARELPLAAASGVPGPRRRRDRDRRLAAAGGPWPRPGRGRGAAGRGEQAPGPRPALSRGRPHGRAGLRAASLELADTPEARTFALEALWRGPVARILPVDTARTSSTRRTRPVSRNRASPDGRWLATRSRDNGHPSLPARRRARTGPAAPPDGNTRVLEFGTLGDILIAGGSGESLRFWSLPDLQEIRSVELGGLWSFGWRSRLDAVHVHPDDEEKPEYLVRAWRSARRGPEGPGGFHLPRMGHRPRRHHVRVCQGPDRPRAPARDLVSGVAARPGREPGRCVGAQIRLHGRPPGLQGQVRRDPAVVSGRGRPSAVAHPRGAGGRCQRHVSRQRRRIGCGHGHLDRRCPVRLGISMTLPTLNPPS